MDLLPTRIDAAKPRDASRLVCIYSAARRGESIEIPDAKRPHEAFALGRFSSHFEAGGQTVAIAELLSERSVSLVVDGTEIMPALTASLRLASVPHAGLLLILTLEFPPGPERELQRAILALQHTCFRRDELRLNGQTILELALARSDISTVLDGLSIDRDVHQILMPGAGLGEELRAQQTDGTGTWYDETRLMRLIFREDVEFSPGLGVINFLGVLSRPTRAVCAHARGVTVLHGAAEHVEWAYVIVACELLAAVGSLRRIRMLATESRAAFETADGERNTLGAVRVQLADISRRLGDLELELSFGVEAYLDALRIPEIVLESYRDSLAAALGVARGAETNARMLSRLKGVLEARSRELAAADMRIQEIRQRRRAVALGYVYLIAVPFALLFGFLGANVAEVGSDNSIFDLGDLGFYYAGIAGVVLMGAVLYFLTWWWAAKKIPKVLSEVYAGLAKT